MDKLQKINNRERNMKLELGSSVIALIASLIFVFSNHIGNLYQIFYVIIVFTIHLITAVLIFNKWNFNTDYSGKKVYIRILIVCLVLIVAFIDLGKISSHYSFYLGFTTDKPRNTFLSVAMYCGIYLFIYVIGLKKINGNSTR